MFEEKEVDLILYSMLIGVAVTFVSLVYYHYESLGIWDAAGGFSSETISVYGFPIGWILSRPIGFLGRFDLGGFLFDVAFWIAVTYAILRYVAPNLITLIQKRERTL